MKDIVTMSGHGEQYNYELELEDSHSGFPAFRFILSTTPGIIRKGVAYE